MILDVNLRLTLGGSSAINGDIYASLQHGDGFAVLLNRPGRTVENPNGYGDSGFDVLLDDDAPNGDIHDYRTAMFGNAVTPLGGPLRSADTGPWMPDGREVDPLAVLVSDAQTAGLSSFNGLGPEGEWMLFIADVAAAGSNVLERWGLDFLVIPRTSEAELHFQNATLRADAGNRILANPVALGGTVQIKGDADLTFSGQLTGIGDLFKTGSGRVVLEGVNTFSGGITLGETLAIGGDRALGLGALNVTGGTLEATDGARVISNPLSLAGDAVFSGTHALEFAGAAGLTGHRNLAVNNTTVFSGQISDNASPGGLTKQGGGVLRLDAPNTFSGGLALEEGTLALGNDQALGAGPLTILGGAIEASGGPRSISNPVTFESAAHFSGSETLTLSGSISENGAAAGLVKDGSGVLRLTGANTFSGGVTLNDGELRVDNLTGSGTGSGPVMIGEGARLSGTGRIDGTVSISGRYSPGSSPGLQETGSQIWNSDGVYEWEINSAGGGAGLDPGWDMAQVNGSLTVAALPEAPFHFRVMSLTLANETGPVADFDPAQQYAWKVLGTTGGITGFSIDTVALELIDFTPEFDGTFRLAQSGNELYLSYAPVPESEAWAASAGFALLAWSLVRRLRREVASGRS